jgi:hypothetical protein
MDEIIDRLKQNEKAWIETQLSKVRNQEPLNQQKIKA